MTFYVTREVAQFKNGQIGKVLVRADRVPADQEITLIGAGPEGQDVIGEPGDWLVEMPTGIVIPLRDDVFGARFEAPRDEKGMAYAMHDSLKESFTKGGGRPILPFVGKA